MKIPVLFKQRQIWFPTLFGSLIIFLVLATILFITFTNAANFLALNKPIKGRFLIVEGWVSESVLLTAINIFHSGHYQLLIITGGPDNRKMNAKSYAEQAARFITNNGFNATKLIVIPAPASAQDRTFLSAVMVRNWFNHNNMTDISLDILSANVHARRTHILYKMAFQPNTAIGIIAAKPAGFTLNSWWKTSDGTKSVLTELIGLTWVTCCFYSGEYGSHQEKWGH